MGFARKHKRRQKAGNSKQEAREARELEELVHDTAAVFTCTYEISRDFADQCGDALETLDADLAFNRVAHEIWAGRPGRPQELAEALAALQRERERHVTELRELEKRFRTLAADENWHEHLEPPEAYRALVRERVFPDTKPSSGA